MLPGSPGRVEAVPPLIEGVCLSVQSSQGKIRCVRATPSHTWGLLGLHPSEARLPHQTDPSDSELLRLGDSTET